MAARHVPGIEALLAKGHGRLAADVESIDAEGYDRIVL